MLKRAILILSCAAAVMLAAGMFLLSRAKSELAAGGAAAGETVAQYRQPYYERDFDVQVLVDGRPLEEYAARGRSYVEAIAGAEYEVTVHNPYPYRVAVALSVDGLNTIDAKHTTAWNSSKWVIAPYGTITVSGWQMSSDRARRFYFTSERDSYGAKLGQTENLGVVSAVFFRERASYPVPLTPPPYPRPYEDGTLDKRERAPDAESNAPSSAPSAGRGEASKSMRRGEVVQDGRDDEYAATGIGRSVRNDVRWVNMELDSRPAGEVTIRYEYYPALVRLGILPRRDPRPDPLRRRERATGFEDRRFSPEP